MNWLVFVFALECGLLPNTGFIMYQPDPAHGISSYFVPIAPPRGRGDGTQDCGGGRIAGMAYAQVRNVTA